MEVVLHSVQLIHSLIMQYYLGWKGLIDQSTNLELSYCTSEVWRAYCYLGCFLLIAALYLWLATASNQVSKLQVFYLCRQVYGAGFWFLLFGQVPFTNLSSLKYYQEPSDTDGTRVLLVIFEFAVCLLYTTLYIGVGNANKRNLYNSIASQCESEERT